jgi:hypothetical protein
MSAHGTDYDSGGLLAGLRAQIVIEKAKGKAMPNPATPLTNALIARHQRESGTTLSSNLAVRQVTELIEHTRRLETDRARLMEALGDVIAGPFGALKEEQRERTRRREVAEALLTELREADAKGTK